ncbi:MAG: hypothetical protein V1824_03720 [archaeon]
MPHKHKPKEKIFIESNYRTNYQKPVLSTSQNNSTNKQSTNPNDLLSKEINYDNISEIIKYFYLLLEANDIFRIDLLHKKCVETAVIKNNKDFAEISIIFYAIQKILSKRHVYDTEIWKNTKEKLITIGKSGIKDLEENNFENFRNKIITCQKLIQDADKSLGHFVTDIISKARVKLSSSAYAYGISVSSAADLYSVNSALLMEYIGLTKMSDEDRKFKSIKERVLILEKGLSK